MRRFTPTALLIISAAIVALLAYGVTSRGGGSSIDAALAEGRAAVAPSWTYRLLGREGDRQDRRLSSRDLFGRPAVLNLWASWCEPCKREAPLLRRAFATNPEVTFLGIDVQDDPQDARAFLRTYGLTYRNVRDPNGSSLDRFAATGLPETYFLRADGRIVGHAIGELRDQPLARGIAAAIAGVPSK